MDDEHAAIYTVGQVASMLDVQAAFLRRLDSEGVVQPVRSDGRQRRYSRSQILLAQRVAGLMDEGLTLAGIRRIIALEAELAGVRAQLAELERRGDGRRRLPRAQEQPKRMTKP